MNAIISLGKKEVRMYEGSCLCGAVKYELSVAPQGITHCHCKMCRKAHGAAYGTYATVIGDQFRFVQGQASVASFHSSEFVTRTFCKHCGATLQWLSDKSPERMSVTLGTLDSPLPQQEQKHIFQADKADWDES